jgi:hypothetical protein
MARLIDDNSVIDFIDDNGEVRFVDDLGNVTFAAEEVLPPEILIPQSCM